jgi:hypothetical protein
MTKQPEQPELHKSAQACAVGLHRSCGGGIVRGARRCECPCHKRLGRPAVQGGRRRGPVP